MHCLQKKLVAVAISNLFIHTVFIHYAYAEEYIDLKPVAVTGNPLGVDSDDLVVPVSVLNGRELSLKRESTLGETLNGFPSNTAHCNQKYHCICQRSKYSSLVITIREPFS